MWVSELSGPLVNFSGPDPIQEPGTQSRSPYMGQKATYLSFHYYLPESAFAGCWRLESEPDIKPRYSTTESSHLNQCLNN